MGVRGGETVVTGITGVVAGRTGVAVATVAAERRPGSMTCCDCPALFPGLEASAQKNEDYDKDQKHNQHESNPEVRVFPERDTPGFPVFGCRRIPTSVRCRPTPTYRMPTPGAGVFFHSAMPAHAWLGGSRDRRRSFSRNTGNKRSETLFPLKSQRVISLSHSYPGLNKGSGRRVRGARKGRPGLRFPTISLFDGEFPGRYPCPEQFQWKRCQRPTKFSI